MTSTPSPAHRARALPPPVVLLATLALACSANPTRARVWAEYERELVRLEAAGLQDERLSLARRGLADPALAPDGRCRLNVEAARTLAAQGRDDDARAHLDAALNDEAPAPCAERVALTALGLWPSAAAARAFLLAHPTSPFQGTVLADLLAPLGPAEALAQLDDLLGRATVPATRCLLQVETARRLRERDPERALALYDLVAATPCARSPEARLEAVSLLADLQRMAELQRRHDETTDADEAWAACRALERAPEGAGLALACLTGFDARFPSSRKVDDAWYLLAERAELRGDLSTARALYRRIIDERPDSGRAARARQRLDALHDPDRP